MGKNQHVVPAGDKWGIKGEGYSRLTSTFDRQSDAIAAARQISKNQHSELFIHGRNGQIRERGRNFASSIKTNLVFNS